jgi:hypothetical protein
MIHEAELISWTSLKLNTSALRKTLVKRMRKQVIDWVKIFAKDISNKGQATDLSNKIVIQNIQRILKTQQQQKRTTSPPKIDKTAVHGGSHL